jgi:hypothetical protein
MLIDVDKSIISNAIGNDINFDMVGMIGNQLIDVIARAPILHPKDLYVADKLEEMFGSYDWLKSFERIQIIIYEELLTSEILVLLHKWLRTKCANIENIILITVQHTGIQSWWHEWCRIHHERSFDIKEMFFLDSPVKNVSMSAFMENTTLFNKSKKFYLTHRHNKWLFSYWGGTYYTDERYYLLLTLSEFLEQAQIDFLGDFGDKNSILAYLENITYYKNQAEINKIADSHDFIKNNQFLVSMRPKSQAQKDELINFRGLQWQIDRQCFASVIRETINSDRYACVTEKTLRVFLHHCVALPIGYRAVQGLEKYGFWFPHDLIDYSYQYIDIFYDRVNGLKLQLQKLAKKPPSDLQDYYINNINNFLYNSKLVANLATQTKNHLGDT